MSHVRCNTSRNLASCQSATRQASSLILLQPAAPTTSRNSLDLSGGSTDSLWPLRTLSPQALLQTLLTSMSVTPRILSRAQSSSEHLIKTVYVTPLNATIADLSIQIVCYNTSIPSLSPPKTSPDSLHPHHESFASGQLVAQTTAHPSAPSTAFVSHPSSSRDSSLIRQPLVLPA